MRYVNDPRIIGRSRTSSRSTPRCRSTSSGSARRRRSTGSTTRRRAARTTSPAARCTPAAARGSSSCTRPPALGRVADRAAARRRRRRHDAEEHGRQGRHRVRRRRAARPLDPRTDPAVDRDRPPRPPRRAHRRGPSGCTTSETSSRGIVRGVVASRASEQLVDDRSQLVCVELTASVRRCAPPRRRRVSSVTPRSRVDATHSKSSSRSSS